MLVEILLMLILLVDVTMLLLISVEGVRSSKNIEIVELKYENKKLHQTIDELNQVIEELEEYDM